MAKRTMSMKKPSAIKAESQIQEIKETEKVKKSPKRVTFTVTEEQHILLKAHCSKNAISVKDFMIDLLEREIFRER